MSRYQCLGLRIACVCGLTLAASAMAFAGTPGVRDSSHLFFSAAAIQQADAQAREIQQLYHKDVLVEVFAEPPAGRRSEVEKMTESDRNHFYDQWAESRMKATDIRDVYVIVSKTPARVQVRVGPETVKTLFTVDDRKKLSSLFVDSFRDKKFDDGLLQGMKFIRDRLGDKMLPVPVVNAVRDHAGYFSPVALQKADARIKEIHALTKRPVVFETLAKLPGHKAVEVKEMSEAARERYFEDLIAQRERAVGGDAIYVMICRAPSHIQVAMGKETQKKTFTVANRQLLVKQLVQDMRAHPDDAVTKGVDFINDKVRANLGLRAAAPATTPKVTATPAPAPTSPTVFKPVEPAKDAARVETDAKPAAADKTAAPDHKDSPTWKERAEKARDTLVEVGEQPVGFKWKYVFWGVLGFLGLWIAIGVLRALFAGGKPEPKHMPSAASTAPAPQARSNPPVGGYQAGANYPQRPAGYQNPGYQQPGYQSGGYVAGNYQSGGGGGGGFMSGLLGGMFGAAAGNWIYDSVSGRNRPTGGIMPSAQAQPPVPQDPYPASPGGITSAGADFEEPVGSSGGDFGAPAQDVAASSGGDFGDTGGSSGGDLADASGSTGGDFGESAGTDDADNAGGDFGANADSGAADAGGDFGSAAESGGGDFDTGASDSGASDSGPSDSSGGGDF